MAYIPKLPDDKVNVTNSNFVEESIKLVVALLLFITVAFSLLTLSTSLIVEHISLDTEKKLQSLFSYNMELDTNSSDKNIIYLQSIVDNLNSCAKLPYNINISISNQEEPNAFAMMGGVIVITKGMLKEIKNENELTFVLGHEMGHFKHRDHLKGLGNSIVLAMISLFVPNSFVQNIISFNSLSYSKSQESSADIFAIEMMMCRYKDTQGSASLFQRMSKDDKWSDFISTHPNFTKRVTEIKKYIKDHGLPYGKDSIKFPLSFQF